MNDYNKIIDYALQFPGAIISDFSDFSYIDGGIFYQIRIQLESFKDPKLFLQVAAKDGLTSALYFRHHVEDSVAFYLQHPYIEPSEIATKYWSKIIKFPNELNESFILKLISDSYQLVFSKLTKKRQAALHHMVPNRYSEFKRISDYLANTDAGWTTLFPQYLTGYTPAIAYNGKTIAKFANNCIFVSTDNFNTPLSIVKNWQEIIVPARLITATK